MRAATAATGTTRAAAGVDGAVPGHLVVYLGNRCNLACSYCYVAVNRGAEARLGAAELRRAIDYFLAAPGPAKRVTFLGGEPLLDWEPLEEALRRLGAAPGGPIPATVFTNGVLLTPERFSALKGYGVRIVLSLDGEAGSNDRHRRFHDGEGRSVFEAVSARLERIPIEGLDVNLVVSPETASALPSNVAFLHARGFERLSLYPTLYDEWTRAELARLERALREVADSYVASFSDPESRPFRLQDVALVGDRLPENAASAWWTSCANLVLGGDGRFHACDRALSFEPGADARAGAGDPARGLDRESRLAAHAKARRFIDDHQPGGDFLYCPMGAYFHGTWSGRGPEKALSSFSRVNGVLLRFYRSISDRLDSDPRFRSMHGLGPKPA